MELNDINLQTLTEFLRKTLDPDPAVRRPGMIRVYDYMFPTEQFKRGQSIKSSPAVLLLVNVSYVTADSLLAPSNTIPLSSSPAEKFLESVEGSQNYPILLLTLLEKSQDNVIRVCAAVTFKNYIKRNWRIVSVDLVVF